MNKEQQTIEKIQELVPEIMKLEFGCKVYIKGIREDNPGCEYDLVVDERIKDGKITLGYFGDIPLTEIEVLGRSITLEDCLIAIKPYIGKTFKYQSYWLNLVSLWKLGKPFQDQSQECKNFIGDLILKN